MEFAGFIGHLMKKGINSFEFLGQSELMEDDSIGGVVVVKASLIGYLVKNF